MAKPKPSPKALPVPIAEALAKAFASAFPQAEMPELPDVVSGFVDIISFVIRGAITMVSAGLF